MVRWQDSKAWWVLGWPVGGLIGVGTLILDKTLRVSVDGPGRDFVGPAVYANWHEHIPYLMRFHGRRDRYQLMSPKPYMQPIAVWGYCLGLRTTRVKAGQRMREGFDTLVALLRDGHDVIFAVDGPAGPAHEVKTGACEVALRAGVPVIPVSYTTASGTRLRYRWDKALFPVPGDRVRVFVGAPIFAQPEEDVPAMTQRLARALGEAPCLPDGR